MNTLPDGALVAWLGDDFTGSATTMEALAFAGVPSVLFLDIPTAEQMARFPQMRGIGIASTARSHSPEWMRDHLPPAFAFLKDTGAPVVHYKVCSTLDSAPHVGSIGAALDIGAPLIGGAWVPCLIASPPQRRYQAFGHLFAGSPQGVFRLDRHPVMARHPVTPMAEADVARHLGQQTKRPFGLVTVEDLETDAAAGLSRELAQGAEVVSLDTMTAPHMATTGDLIWQAARTHQTFVIGSQGVEYALVDCWRKAGLIPCAEVQTGAGAVDQLIVVSGSVSPITAQQIALAEADGFTGIALDAAALVTGDTSAEDATYQAALGVLAKGGSPLIYSARGPDDPAVARMRAAVQAAGVREDDANARIGATLGRLLSRLLRETGLRRAVISGGDTSGYASRQLDLFAFTALSPATPGAALLEAHSDDPALAGLQLALKGGQMGSPDYFSWIKRGGGAAQKG
ncbi:four-carbon acid sugar kinase family protein [Thioclava sp. A2]|uniref:four-carbon acid sugar kinase family protein n=1 Tax=Thioclava sp. FCG-A2 TaxID=3080562 RepID=UPI00295451A8|nr:four-carbon acid sugar kinase family protein [Thioclava sp. A2]MDV7271606.1 four-carbon acid sugar kinase family protein [Thioclava sp. A2]